MVDSLASSIQNNQSYLKKMKAVILSLCIVESHCSGIRRARLTAAAAAAAAAAIVDVTSAGMSTGGATGGELGSVTGGAAAGSRGSTTDMIHHKCFDDTIRVETDDTCGSCLCATINMEEKSHEQLSSMLDDAEEFCLQQLRIRDGVNPDRLPIWVPGSPSKSSTIRVTQEMQNQLKDNGANTLNNALLEVEREDGPLPVNLEDSMKIESVTGITFTTGTTGTTGATGATGATGSFGTGPTGASTGPNAEVLAQQLRTESYKRILNELTTKLKKVAYEHQTLRQKISRVPTEHHVSMDTTAGDVNVMDSGTAEEDNVPSPVSTEDRESVLNIRKLRKNLNSLNIGTDDLMDNLKRSGIYNETRLHQMIGEAATGPIAVPIAVEFDATGMTGSQQTGSTGTTGGSNRQH